MKTAIVIPARSTSNRLPRKHLMEITPGMTLIQVLLERMKMITPEVDIILATPLEDIAYQEVARDEGVKWFGGPQYRVLERVVKATRGYETIVLVNGDSPLMCPRLIDRMIKTFEHDGLEVLVNRGPSGFRAKVIQGRFLGKWLEWVDRAMEHILQPGISQKRDSFCMSHSTIKFSIDTMEDLQYIRWLMKEVDLDAPLRTIVKTAIALGSYTNNGTGDPTGHSPIGSTPVD